MSTVRGIFFDEDDARSVAARLRADGFEAAVRRERLSGEDDDEDHPWAVLTDAPEAALDLLVERHDGWLDVAGDATEPRPPAPDLPTSPRRRHRSPQD
jgi:hypothetical protein